MCVPTAHSLSQVGPSFETVSCCFLVSGALVIPPGEVLCLRSLSLACGNRSSDTLSLAVHKQKGEAINKAKGHRHHVHIDQYSHTCIPAGAGTKRAWALSKDMAGLVDGLRAAAARCVPKQGARQLPKEVLDCLPGITCALKREAARKKGVATEQAVCNPVY